VLAVCGDLGCTRERLVALLWPESDESRAQQGLRDALYAIRRALGPDAVLSGSRLLRLDPAVVVSDVDTLAQALSSGRHAEAVGVYAGPLLDGFHVDDATEFERWLDDERTRLARQCAEALEHLATEAERAGAWHEAVGWWGRAVEHDPVNSHFVLQHARAMTAIGDRANALKAADAHARRLREELDLEPDGDFLASIERIRRGETPARPGLLPRPTPGPAEDMPQAAESLPYQAPAAPSGATAAALTPPTSTAGRSPHLASWAAAVFAVLVVLAGILAARHWLSGPARNARPPRTAIAVLPFQSISADSSYAYFAGGLHDELQSQLTKVASLSVIGLISVREYQRSSKPPRQIGEELGVGSIVHARVQVIGNRLRVIVQLFDTFTQRELWSEVYNRTLGDAFAVQSDIAQRIVAEVGAALTSTEAGAIAAAPTQNPHAYDFYLQGLDYWRRSGFLRPNLESAQQLFERALTLDSSFALAHAALSRVHFMLNRYGYDPSPARLDLAQREAEVALRLAPDLPQAHLAVGLARYGARGDMRRGMNEIRVALRSAPNDAELWAWMGEAIHLGGNPDSAIAAFRQAQRLDPRNANLLHIMGDAYHFLHRYPEAIESYRRAIALAPDVAQVRLSMAWSYVLWKGNLDTLRAVLQGLPQEADPGMGGGSVASNRLLLFQMERRPDSVLALIRRMGLEADPGTEISVAAPAHLLRGDTAAARAAYAAAAAALEVQERAHPDDGGVHGMRGIALAALGRRADALREARWIAKSAAYHQYPDVAGVRAEILARIGETDAALADLERVLVGPSYATAPSLRLFPNWDPILVDPRFQALLAKYADPEARTR
jgi:TolB-like protein/DNA-binding SARP family transcriptional activator/Flp pilus assembly protein TadD